ncbi:HD domain-containing phosphohydrolase [Mesobacillus harenae]|uniref:HD domain-containing phosphohydrolase n=1 Tax=Mesobacillus harenae TaxID=2213203 RepID=UPI001580E661
MHIHVNQLQEGCILSRDVISSTNRPIMLKKTILSQSLIEVLKAFLIDEVYVEKTLVNGDSFTPAINLNIKASHNDPEELEALTFTDLFLRQTQKYKREFLTWQSGLPIDIYKVRNILLPLIEQADNRASEIFSMHHFSTKEDYIYQHSLAMGIISATLARKLNYNTGDIIQIGLAGCLADCGMAKINNRILNKTTTLTIEEYEEVKNHSSISYQMIKNISLLRDGTKLAIIQHHERLDGSGYPFGERGSRIHPFAKVIAIADVFHAMTSERIYKPKLSAFKVIEMINEQHFGEFDIRTLKVLDAAIMNFSNGSKIRLSNGHEAEILFIEEKSPTRPLIKLLENGEIIHLEQNRQLYIDEVLT